MKEVLINSYIGYDWFSEDGGVTVKSITRQLEGLAAGEDIRISINSAGGSASEGFVIFNMIRDYAKTHSVSVVIDCMAMSIASYIALAARTVDAKAIITARENSIFAIHNPYMYTHGDYRELKKMSDYLEKITAVYASAHIAVSGKTEKEIRAAMDNETFYVGQEIEAMGFANDYEVASNPENEISESPAARRDNIIITAKFALNRAIENVQKAEAKNPAAYNSDLEKVAALITPNTPAASSAKPGEEININLGGIMKTPEELLAQNKELYNAVFALGEKAGLEKERARVNAHLLLGEKSESLALAAKHIKAGVSTSDETAQAEYFATKLDKGRISARNEDNVDDIHTGGEAGAGGGPEDDARISAAFDRGFAGKDLGGKPWME